ncbi:MAG: hypothetical protein HN995_00795 [Candidatus Marinimicrobia bacterium]|jgi:hypothetical protein|nr:hypothetical protein [Candidatus Neomarinimicrobiota bacterium]MBT3575335.1 hypothetical protein [Candidatus Neomarinimicrobiota bacterium]MBT3680750.1 hypothetical protein [Candidatus Neomarinimicrobiota bacterium]MBT3950106.1 hypothetical protein [Candidatus Neomarinimicrobiota bacterium]MBT4253766.1 hypothetical protein [Candidatus Neomarinimicrobiota bacterium]
MKIKRTIQSIIPLLLLVSCVYQRPDMHTDMTVVSPKFDLKKSPVVLFDAGHGNFHDIQSTYKPFATLLKNDGIILITHTGRFTQKALRNVDLLIISNAMGEEQKDGGMTSAFEESEILVLTDWIKAGGSLLLIADHDPFGSASADLAQAWGVGMESVWTVDTLRINPEIGRNSWLEYTQENGGLGKHPILQANSQDSAIQGVITFTGQSLNFDSTWTSVLQLSNSAQNYYTRAEAKVLATEPSTFFPVSGQSQLIARQYGEGRIVIAGEAAMFTAQEVRIFFKTMRAGFNYTGYDNKKFVLNVIHWLLFEID